MSRVFASCSSAEPGSVIATKRSPSPSVCSQKYSKWASVSSVVPDFEETTNIVSSRSIESTACRIIAGCVVSRTCRLFTPNVRFSTSGASDEPPMPSRTNVVKRERASSANARMSSSRSWIRFGSSSQPSQRSSSAPVQTVASRAQIRSTSSCWLATATRRPSSRCQLAPLGADPVEQLLERIGKLLLALLLQRLDDAVVVDAGLGEIVQQPARFVNALRQRLGDSAVILEGLDRLLRHRVHRRRPDQLLDVHHVAVLGVLRRGGCPQAALL